MSRKIFKCSIEFDEHGRVKITSHSNQKIGGHLFNMLNKAIHQVREDYNCEATWKKSYIHFSHEGRNYEQVDAIDLCKGCVFSSIIRCKHPHYLSETKGDCTGKIYKQV